MVIHAVLKHHKKAAGGHVPETDAIPFLSAGGNPHSEPSRWRGLPQDRMHRAVWLAADHLEGRSQQFPFVSFRLGRCILSISVPIIQIAGRNVNAGQSLSGLGKYKVYSGKPCKQRVSSCNATQDRTYVPEV
jgi:hypothetical protein